MRRQSLAVGNLARHEYLAFQSGFGNKPFDSIEILAFAYQQSLETEALFIQNGKAADQKIHILQNIYPADKKQHLFIG